MDERLRSKLAAVLWRAATLLEVWSFYETCWQTLLQVRKEQQLSTFGLLKENATFLLELRGTTSLELEMPTYINVF